MKKCQKILVEKCFPKGRNIFSLSSYRYQVPGMIILRSVSFLNVLIHIWEPSRSTKIDRYMNENRQIYECLLNSQKCDHKCSERHQRTIKNYSKLCNFSLEMCFIVIFSIHIDMLQNILSKNIIPFLSTENGGPCWQKTEHTCTVHCFWLNQHNSRWPGTPLLGVGFHQNNNTNCFKFVLF